MKLHDTDKIYELLLPMLQDLERERAAAAKYASQVKTNLLAITAVVGLIIFGVALGTGKHLGIAFLVGFAVWAIIAFIIYSCTAGKKIAAYRQHYKSKVVRGVVQQMEPGLGYSEGSGIPESVFEGSRLFSHSADRYSCEDGFRGTIGETQVFFSEVHAEYKTTSTDSKGNTTTSYHTFFDGLFMVADFHKHFRSHVRVLPDVAEKSLGFLGKALQKFRPFSSEKLVYMEDPEFEKQFVVYGEDQVEARYILSTSMLRRILDLREKWQDDIRLGFKDSSVQIAISHSGDLLEPETKHSALARKQIEQLVWELQLCFSIVEDLNLNTRVWTKE